MLKSRFEIICEMTGFDWFRNIEKVPSSDYSLTEAKQAHSNVVLQLCDQFLVSYLFANTLVSI